MGFRCHKYKSNFDLRKTELIVVANTSSTSAPIGESPIAKY